MVLTLKLNEAGLKKIENLKRLTDTKVSQDEVLLPVTPAVIEEMRRGEWSIGGPAREGHALAQEASTGG